MQADVGEEKGALIVSRDIMAASIERKSPSGSSCDEQGKTVKRGLGPEFIYPFLVLFFATILRKFLR